LKTPIPIDFDEFVNTINKKGKNVAKILAKERYNLSFEQVRRRLFLGTDYCFDSVTRLYKHKDEGTINAEFISLEELDKMKPSGYKNKGIEALTGANPSSNSDFDEIVRDLIKDRLMELSKYVSIDHGSRKLVIKTNILNRDGISLVVI
jgi:hypothetical protein